MILLFLILLDSCGIDRDRAVERDKFTFRTGDDTELFFRNIRQSDYDLEQNKAAKFNIFRHRKRIDSDTVANLNLAIVMNVLDDEAYLVVEPSGVIDGEEELVLLRTAADGADTLRLAEQNRTEYLEFAAQVYEGLLQNASFYVIADGRKFPVLSDPVAREVFRITTSDYFRLTRIY